MNWGSMVDVINMDPGTGVILSPQKMSKSLAGANGRDRAKELEVSKIPSPQ